MRHRRSRFLLCIGAVLLSVSAVGAEAWLEKCFECHGADGMGKSDPAYPVIAGIPAAHIEEAIYAYIDGARQCLREPRMCETVASWTADQVSAAAEYFSGRAREYNLEKFDPELAARGAVLHERHCGACHLPPHDEDVAYAIGIPLHGQRAGYIRDSIRAYFSGKREPLLDTMAHENGQFDDRDFEALVNYYSSYRARN